MSTNTSSFLRLMFPCSNPCNRKHRKNYIIKIPYTKHKWLIGPANSYQQHDKSNNATAVTIN